MVGVLEQVTRLRDPPRAEIDGHHRLRTGQARPPDELVEAEGVGLDRPPGQIEPAGAVRRWADAVLPPVAGDEVAARVAHHGHAELSRQLEHVGAQPVGPGSIVARLEEPTIDTSTHVLYEGAEETRVDRADPEIRVESD